MVVVALLERAWRASHRRLPRAWLVGRLGAGLLLLLGLGSLWRRRSGTGAHSTCCCRLLLAQVRLAGRRCCGGRRVRRLPVVMVVVVVVAPWRLRAFAPLALVRAGPVGLVGRTPARARHSQCEGRGRVELVTNNGVRLDFVQLRHRLFHLVDARVNGIHASGQLSNILFQVQLELVDQRDDLAKLLGASARGWPRPGDVQAQWRPLAAATRRRWRLAQQRPARRRGLLLDGRMPAEQRRKAGLDGGAGRRRAARAAHLRLAAGLGGRRRGRGLVNGAARRVLALLLLLLLALLLLVALVPIAACIWHVADDANVIRLPGNDLDATAHGR